MVYRCTTINFPQTSQLRTPSPMLAKKEITDKILSLLRTLPKDRISHYASFKDVQIERFLNPEKIAKISEQDLKLQYISLRDLVNDKYKNLYKLDDKLLKPKGNPRYYDRILSEIKGEKKETWGDAIRTVYYGK